MAQSQSGGCENSLGPRKKKNAGAKKEPAVDRGSSDMQADWGDNLGAKIACKDKERSRPRHKSKKKKKKADEEKKDSAEVETKAVIPRKKSPKRDKNKKKSQRGGIKRRGTVMKRGRSAASQINTTPVPRG